MESTVMAAKFFESVAWLKANLKNVIIGAVAVIVLVCVVSWFFYNRSQREVWASQALSEVQTPSSGMQPPLPGQGEAYLKVAKEYSGTKAAARALLEAAGVNFVQRNYAESQKLFERMLKEYPESPWRAEATLGVAANLEQLGKTNEAVAKYEEVRRNPTAAVVDEAKLSVARLYEAQGKNIDALKMYDELLKAYPYGGLGMEAGIRLEELTNRYPALATNLAPIVPPTLPPTALMTTNRPPTNRVIRMTNFPPAMRTNLATNRITLTNPAAVNPLRPTTLATNSTVPATGTNPPAVRLTPPKPAPGANTNK